MVSPPPPPVARAWLFIGFLFAFGGLIGSLWIFIQQFLVPGLSVGDIIVMSFDEQVVLTLCCIAHVQLLSNS